MYDCVLLLGLRRRGLCETHSRRRWSTSSTVAPSGVGRKEVVVLTRDAREPFNRMCERLSIAARHS